MKSCLRTSAIVPRTAREMMPAGITDSVKAGRMRWLRLVQLNPNPPAPSSSMPVAGSRFRFTANTMTTTMPSQ